MLYVYHALRTQPRSWQTVSVALQSHAPQTLTANGGHLYGVFRHQIGRPRDELTVITAWPDGRNEPAERAFFAVAGEAIQATDSCPMRATLRPQPFAAPTRQGNFAFRWFETPLAHYDEFLSLCASAWPGFEASYDSQVLGLWRFEDATESAAETARTVMLTRRPNLAMWERSKIPSGAAETEVRRKLNRRYELCDATWVFTTTLLSAQDRSDEVRWS